MSAAMRTDGSETDYEMNRVSLPDRKKLFGLDNGVVWDFIPLGDRLIELHCEMLFK